MNTGDEGARQKLINKILRFVVSCAKKKYEGKGLPLADLIAEGNQGLITALQKGDHTRGIKIISFAVWWIRQSILAAINDYRRMIRLPTNQIADVYELFKAEGDLEQVLERKPTLEELAVHTGISLDKVERYSGDPMHTTFF